LSADEPAAQRWCLGVDAVAVKVYCHVMVVPAERCKVVRVVCSAVCEAFDVVGLKPVSAVASIDNTSTVTVGDMVSESWRDCA